MLRNAWKSSANHVKTLIVPHFYFLPGHRVDGSRIKLIHPIYTFLHAEVVEKVHKRLH